MSGMAYFAISEVRSFHTYSYMQHTDKGANITLMLF